MHQRKYFLGIGISASISMLSLVSLSAAKAQEAESKASVPSTIQSTNAVPDNSAGSSAAAQNFTLHGGVTHSDQLPHVSTVIDKHRHRVKLNFADATSDTSITSNTASTAPPLQAEADDSTKKQGYLPLTGIAQPHNDTSTKNLSAEVHKVSAEWFMIPKWLAGKWFKQGDLTVSVTDLATGQEVFQNQWVDNKMDATWGHQIDAAGNFWHVNFLPSERDGKSDGKAVRFLTVQQRCEKTSPAALVTRTQYVVSESNFWNGPPVEMFQQESLNHYVPTESSDAFMNISTNRVFTYEGQAVRDGHLKTQYTKTGPFQTVATINGIDLKESLNEYLDEHGLSDLKVK